MKPNTLSNVYYHSKTHNTRHTTHDMVRVYGVFTSEDEENLRILANKRRRPSWYCNGKSAVHCEEYVPMTTRPQFTAQLTVQIPKNPYEKPKAQPYAFYQRLKTCSLIKYLPNSPKTPKTPKSIQPHSA